MQMYSNIIEWINHISMCKKRYGDEGLKLRHMYTTQKYKNHADELIGDWKALERFRYTNV